MRPPSPNLESEHDSASEKGGYEEREYTEPIFKWTMQPGGVMDIENAYFDIDSNCWKTWEDLAKLDVIAGNLPPKKTSNSTANIQKI